MPQSWPCQPTFLWETNREEMFLVQTHSALLKQLFQVLQNEALPQSTLAFLLKALLHPALTCCSLTLSRSYHRGGRWELISFYPLFLDEPPSNLQVPLSTMGTCLLWEWSIFTEQWYTVSTKTSSSTLLDPTNRHLCRWSFGVKPVKISKTTFFFFNLRKI